MTTTPPSTSSPDPRNDERDVLVCPACNSSESLWQGATRRGWVVLNADGTTGTQWESDGFGHKLDDYEYGCGCGWESSARPVVQ